MAEIQCDRCGRIDFDCNPEGIALHVHCPSGVHVVRADSFALFRHEVLATAKTRGIPIRLVDDGHICTDTTHHPVGEPCFTGWLLHIDADRHLVYRIGDYEWLRDCWEGRWPD